MSLLTVSILICVTSINFTQMKHPLAMGLTLLIQTILICGGSGLNSKSMWFSYILFLIFLGAMLVLFVYVASLASNEPFKLSSTMLIASSLILLISLVSLMIDPLFILNKETTLFSSISSDNFLNSTETTIYPIYSPTWANLTSFIILYLLLTLIVVVKITSTFFGPLRLS